MALLLRPRMIGGVSHVDDDGHFRIQPEGAGPRAATAEPDLLFDRRHRNRPHRGPIRSESTECLQRHQGSHAVIDRPRDDASVRQVDDVGHHHGRVADANQRSRVVAAPGSDVDPEILDLRRLLTLLLLLQMDRLLAHHPDDGALSRQDLHALPDQDLRIPTAYGRKVKEPVVVDVIDHQADLIDVSREHYAKLGVGVDGREAVTLHVRPHTVGEPFGFGPPGAGRGGLVTGRPGQRQQALEKLHSATLHRQWLDST